MAEKQQHKLRAFMYVCARKKQRNYMANEYMICVAVYFGFVDYLLLLDVEHWIYSANNR